MYERCSSSTTGNWFSADTKASTDVHIVNSMSKAARQVLFRILQRGIVGAVAERLPRRWKKYLCFCVFGVFGRGLYWVLFSPPPLQSDCGNGGGGGCGLGERVAPPAATRSTCPVQHPARTQRVTCKLRAQCLGPPWSDFTGDNSLRPMQSRSSNALGTE
jgi:hypothetical protein